jgi:hypothetical protein
MTGMMGKRMKTDALGFFRVLRTGPFRKRPKPSFLAGCELFPIFGTLPESA